MQRSGCKLQRAAASFGTPVLTHATQTHENQCWANTCTLLQIVSLFFSATPSGFTLWILAQTQCCGTRMTLYRKWLVIITSPPFGWLTYGWNGRIKLCIFSVSVFRCPIWLPYCLVAQCFPATCNFNFDKTHCCGWPLPSPLPLRAFHMLHYLFLPAALPFFSNWNHVLVAISHKYISRYISNCTC